MCSPLLAPIPTRDDDGSTPLHAAAGSNHAAVVQALIEVGANRAAPDCLFGGRPLHVVLRSARNAEVLIASGASVAAVDRRGRTPLHTVAHLMRWEEGTGVITTIIAHGARSDAREKDE